MQRSASTLQETRLVYIRQIADSKKNNRIKVKYKVTNLINDRSYFIFGTHFGLTCSDKHRIDIPAKKLIFDDFVDGGNLAEKGKDYKYPYLYNSLQEVHHYQW